MMDGDPTEMVSCGKCKQVNTVPYGLDKFKCFNCGVMVGISREQSAACAAASPTAIYYSELQESVSGNSTAPSPGNQAGPNQSTEKKSSSSSSFLGKLTKTMGGARKSVEKTFEKTFENLGNKPAEPAVTSGHKAGPPLSDEDQQLQWALSASLAEAHGSTTQVAPVIKEQTAAADNDDNRANKTSIASSNAGDQLQAAAAQAASRLQAAEERAARAERELLAAQAREAAMESEKNKLRNQLAENESLIKGLTEQLDTVNTRVAKESERCRVLEDSVRKAQEAATYAELTRQADSGDDDTQLEHQGTIAQLLARIAELESTLVHATHFAPQQNEEDTADRSAQPILQANREGGSDAVEAQSREDAHKTSESRVLDPAILSEGLAGQASSNLDGSTPETEAQPISEDSHCTSGGNQLEEQQKESAAGPEPADANTGVDDKDKNECETEVVSASDVSLKSESPATFKSTACDGAQDAATKVQVGPTQTEAACTPEAA